MNKVTDYINGVIEGLNTIDSELSSDQVIKILESIKTRLHDEDDRMLTEIARTIQREFSKRPLSAPTTPLPSAPMPMWPSSPWTDENFKPTYNPTEIIC